VTGAWQVLPLQRGTADQLLSDGVALFEDLRPEQPAILRWYRSTAPAIVLGRGQGALAIEPDGLPVLTRLSGGGAVWLSPDVLSLDVLLPAGHRWLANPQLTEVFVAVGRCWAEALDDLGVGELTVHQGRSTAQRRGSPRQQLLAAVCYATRGAGEVLWRERKLVGMAQRRRRPGAMIQCGLLRRWRPQQLVASLGAEPDDPEILQAAVGLDDLMSGAPDDETLMRAVEKAFGA